MGYSLIVPSFSKWERKFQYIWNRNKRVNGDTFWSDMKIMENNHYSK